MSASPSLCSSLLCLRNVYISSRFRFVGIFAERSLYPGVNWAGVEGVGARDVRFRGGCYCT